MSEFRELLKLRYPHPFPARMAPSIAFDALGSTKRKGLRVLDPMAGSGTSVLVSALEGHRALGFDTDPLAVLMSSVWTTMIDFDDVRKRASAVLDGAKKRSRKIPLRNAYPARSDAETRAFVRYWFENENRKQLRVLVDRICRTQDEGIRNVLWCAFSRLIIAKSRGASRALDLSHGRPHRVEHKEKFRPLDNFHLAVERVLSAIPKRLADTAGRPSVLIGDARKLPLDADSVDVVITSPPYLNAIDYVRCSKFSLVWMGHSIRDLRALRASNVGTEAKGNLPALPSHVSDARSAMCDGDALPAKQRGLLQRYVLDMDAVVSELVRVLAPGGVATMVIGDCNIKGVFVQNSAGLQSLAEHHGLKLINLARRELPPNRRYLPPPSARSAGAFSSRMREEVVLSCAKRR